MNLVNLYIRLMMIFWSIIVVIFNVYLYVNKIMNNVIISCKIINFCIWKLFVVKLILCIINFFDHDIFIFF